MNKQERIGTVFLYGVFIFYILFLIKLLLLSRVPLFEVFNSQRTLHRSINLIPFHSISEYISGSTINLRRFAFSNLVGNIIIFIPLGIYLTLFKKDKRIIPNLLFIFIVSLFVEVIQGLLALGTADIDDIILNCLGGLVGILGYKFLLLLLKGEKKVRVVITIISAIGLPVLLYLLFMVRLRL
ncbi:teicoplanin resistance protein VanZ [Clostridium carboxidivorans P7]|uniref:VanZ family protein n=1 Tax=Clostridium carboxidivorans P7 TaxID=536227 RepID=C6PTE2_9CLOT|nr:VanZ family protein [Clostridium carboxidivorans]AKN33749.1 teicoplanin resistance protein VanZ [Clostridium carboxidivorans P7]EET87465.1 VanZ family protein [Clostridium carboxidivorans P7]EFG86648.1 VanZ like family protein [Clostridium carboxidivorans P7]